MEEIVFKEERYNLKKILLLLFLVITLLPLSAYTYQTESVVVRTQVSKITLSQAAVANSGDGLSGLYKLYGGLESASDAKLDSLIAEDISEDDIKVYFRVAQLAKTRTDESISISVEAESLVNVDSNSIISRDSSMIVSTEVPVISDISCLNIEALSVDYIPEDVNGIRFLLNYSMGKPVENINLAFFTVTWKKTPGLAPGEYISKITLSYITN